MKVAIPVSRWGVATTLDFARQLLLVECEGDREIRRTRITLEETLPVNRARRLERLNVQVLICGAISRPLAAMLRDSGVRVIPLVSGKLEDVLTAFFKGRLTDPRFLLAGCTSQEREALMSCGRGGRWGA